MAKNRNTKKQKREARKRKKAAKKNRQNAQPARSSQEYLNGMSYDNFVKYINNLRAESTEFGFTDKSRIHERFLGTYRSIVGEGRPSVTEYGAGVPLLGLYLLAQERIKKLVAIESDPSVLKELKHIASKTSLPIDIIDQPFESLDALPDTEVGVSMNFLYGPAPTFYQGATNVHPSEIPNITDNIFERSTHDRLWVFRLLQGMGWDTKEKAISDAEAGFEDVQYSLDHMSETVKGYIRQRDGWVEGRRVEYDLHSLTTRTRK